MQYRDRKSGQMRLRLAYMGKIAGLALIQASVSAIGLLLTNIVWNKWQSCNIEVANKTVIYRTGLWEKCIDELVLAKSTCTPLEAEHAAGAFKAVIVLMLLAISLQCLCVIMGLIIRNYEKQRAMIIVPVLFNFGAALSGTVGLCIFTQQYDKTRCYLSASYVMGWLGMVEVYLSCLFYTLVALGK